MTGAVASLVLAGAAFAYLGVLSIVLVIIDLRAHRLPNRVVLPGYAVALLLFAAASTLDGHPARLLRAVAGMAILFACFFAMRLASPASLGGGDVKLAGLLGLYFGWIGWGGLVIGTAAAFLIGGAQAIALILLRRADRRSRIAFGPAMLGGAWVAIAMAALPNVTSWPSGV
ncbi:A24 family peptidase [Microbacterium sp. zg.B48]|uniref:prepilin peptidase n=1 Tax=Microbacterium sp. zg.B48 TaxID=2969408 RepID=UPI00214C3922|nr:A24 family peptidase [Microbacterium sp. zg.B48]MCR2763399.1 A24 family peptidase [Microbacterium sp. zg.B48]